MREALAGLTVRGRAFLAAGITAIACAIVLDQSALTRVGILVLVLPLRLRSPLGELSFFTTAAVFGTAADVTLSELTIEQFFPADAATDAAVRRLSA